MASVFRQMLVMVKTVEARSTSKTGQRDYHAVPEMPAYILKFQVSFTTQVKRCNLNNRPNQWVSNQCDFQCKRLQSISSQGTSETGKSPVTNSGYYREILVSVSICVCACVTCDIKACCSLQVVHANYDFHSLIRKWSLQLCHCITTRCCTALSFILRFLLAMLAVAHPPWKFQADQLWKEKHQPCSGPRFNFLLDFSISSCPISSLPTTTFSKRRQGRRCTCTAIN